MKQSSYFSNKGYTRKKSVIIGKNREIRKSHVLREFGLYDPRAPDVRSTKVISTKHTPKSSSHFYINGFDDVVMARTTINLYPGYSDSSRNVEAEKKESQSSRKINSNRESGRLKRIFSLLQNDSEEQTPTNSLQKERNVKMSSPCRINPLTKSNSKKGSSHQLSRLISLQKEVSLRSALRKINEKITKSVRSVVAVKTSISNAQIHTEEQLPEKTSFRKSHLQLETMDRQFCSTFDSNGPVSISDKKARLLNIISGRVKPPINPVLPMCFKKLLKPVSKKIEEKNVRTDKVSEFQRKKTKSQTVNTINLPKIMNLIVSTRELSKCSSKFISANNSPVDSQKHSFGHNTQNVNKQNDLLIISEEGGQSSNDESTLKQIEIQPFTKVREECQKKPQRIQTTCKPYHKNFVGSSNVVMGRTNFKNESGPLVKNSQATTQKLPSSRSSIFRQNSSGQLTMTKNLASQTAGKNLGSLGKMLGILKNDNSLSKGRIAIQEKMKAMKSQIGSISGENSLSYTLFRDFEVYLGEFKVLEIIGEGSNAVVYKALKKDPIIPGSGVFAVKVYHKKHFSNDQRIKGLEVEIHSLQTIDHCSVIKLYQAIEGVHHHFLIFEFGGLNSLEKLLNESSENKLTPKDAGIYLSQLADAIQAVHSNGFAHRDLKHQNILVDLETQRIKLIDFGYAVRFNGETTVSDFCGTPSYMAPEIVARAPYNAWATDIWSFGVLAYRILTGRFPFQVKSEELLFESIKNDVVRISDRIPREAIQMIQSCLQKNPRDRPSIAALMKTDYFVHTYSKDSQSTACDEAKTYPH